MSNYEKVGKNITIEKMTELFKQSLDIYSRSNEEKSFSLVQAVTNCMFLGHKNFMSVRDRMSTYL